MTGVNPGLVVSGLADKMLVLPVLPRQAQELTGLGAEVSCSSGGSSASSLDASAARRAIWQLDPHNVTFGNPAWEVALATVKDSACLALGIKNATDVKAEVPPSRAPTSSPPSAAARQVQTSPRLVVVPSRTNTRGPCSGLCPHFCRSSAISSCAVRGPAPFRSARRRPRGPLPVAGLRLSCSHSRPSFSGVNFAQATAARRRCSTRHAGKGYGRFLCASAQLRAQMTSCHPSRGSRMSPLSSPLRVSRPCHASGLRDRFRAVLCRLLPRLRLRNRTSEVRFPGSPRIRPGAHTHLLSLPCHSTQPPYAAPQQQPPQICQPRLIHCRSPLASAISGRLRARGHSKLRLRQPPS